jgi:hypothetical protein
LEEADSIKINTKSWKALGRGAGPLETLLLSY